MSPNADQLRREVKTLCNEGRFADAIDVAWKLYDAAPDDLPTKMLVVDILRIDESLAGADRRQALMKMLRDRDIAPYHITPVAWRFLQNHAGLFTEDMQADPSRFARALEDDVLALALLSEDLVTIMSVEKALTKIRHWLIFDNRRQNFPKLWSALVAQTRLNGGAWLFDEGERAQVNTVPALEEAYWPARTDSKSSTMTDPVTRLVADQYEGWPYPHWTRIGRGSPTTLAKVVAKLDPEGPDSIPASPEILIAGCGTGRQTAIVARNFPDARITAIDISSASLAYAAQRFSENGLKGVETFQMDLLEVSKLGRRFDMITCTGVLMALADPEKGWAALVDVLKPGGAIHIMLYSKIARMRIYGLQTKLKDLIGGPIDDDVLREVRRRVSDNPLANSISDFYSLSGVFDLLMHRHEDAFDVPRIRRAIESLGLQFLGFNPPDPVRRKQYRNAHPDDPLFRDYDAWAMLEAREPSIFFGMYDFWCRKPLE